MQKLLLLIFLPFSFFSFSQNLIPNGDFELGPNRTSAEWLWGMDSDCVFTDTVLGPDYWTVVEPSPDRLVEGDIFCGWNNDTAQSGNAFIVLGYSPPGETGKTTLLSSLEADSLYYLKYYISYQGGCSGTPSPARVTFKFNGGDSIISPFILNNQSWTEYDTIFIASANSTEIEISGSGTLNSCSNVDNISLIKVTSSFVKNNVQTNSIKIYPNPSLGFLYITDDNIGDIRIYNLLGQGMKFSFFKENNTFSLNLSELSSGVYFIQVKKNHALINSKFFLKN